MTGKMLEFSAVRFQWQTGNITRNEQMADTMTVLQINSGYTHSRCVNKGQRNRHSRKTRIDKTKKRKDYCWDSNSVSPCLAKIKKRDFKSVNDVASS